MNLTSKEALELLELDKTNTINDNWIYHSICVGDSAGRIAEKLKLDVDKAKALGYVHDIGKRYGYEGDGALTHGINGYNYLKELGYDEEYAGICILHSYLNNDIDCLAGNRSNKNGIEYNFQKEYVENREYTDYEKIINLCDLMCNKQIMTMEKRLIDLLVRHGAHETTSYHIKEALKLKKYFDDKLGCSVYDLFPEIKENL